MPHSGISRILCISVPKWGQDPNWALPQLFVCAFWCRLVRRDRWPKKPAVRLRSKSECQETCTARFQRDASHRGHTINAEILRRIAHSFEAGNALETAEKAITKTSEALADFRQKMEGLFRGGELAPEAELRGLIGISYISKHYNIPPETVASAIERLRKDKEPDK